MAFPITFSYDFLIPLDHHLSSHPTQSFLSALKLNAECHSLFLMFSPHTLKVIMCPGSILKHLNKHRGLTLQLSAAAYPWHILDTLALRSALAIPTVEKFQMDFFLSHLPCSPLMPPWKLHALPLYHIWWFGSFLHQAIGGFLFTDNKDSIVYTSINTFLSLRGFSIQLTCIISFWATLDGKIGRDMCRRPEYPWGRGCQERDQSLSCLPCAAPKQEFYKPHPSQSSQGTCEVDDMITPITNMRKQVWGG